VGSIADQREATEAQSDEGRPGEDWTSSWI